MLLLRILLPVLLSHQSASNPCGPYWREWRCQCYYSSESYLDWHAANDACKSMDSQLVSLHSQEELDFIHDLNNKGSDYSFWTGLNNIKDANVWSYTDGTKLDFLNEYFTEPKNLSDSRCMEVQLRQHREPFTETSFNSTYCELSKLYVCKKISEIHPLLAEDLVSPAIYPQASAAVLYWKNWPVFEGCSRSVLLSNQYLNRSLFIHGPNQTNDFSYQIKDLQPKTSYDFVLIPSGENELANTITFITEKQNTDSESSIIDFSCDRGWEVYKCHCYHLSTEKVSRRVARRRCEEMGADLVSIHSEDEQKFVSSMHTEQIWIGLSDKSREGSYSWSDGSLYDFRWWHSGEPNNIYNEDCVENAAWGYSAKWNDIPCTLARQYVCKKKSLDIKHIPSPTVLFENKNTVLFWQKTLPCLKMQVTNIRRKQQWIIESDSNDYSLTIDNLQPKEFQFFHIIPVLQNEEEEERLEIRIVFLTPECVDCFSKESMEEGCPAVFECPVGWVSRGCYCYQFRDVAETWHEAADACQSMESNLLSILSMDEQQFIDNYNDEEVWLGLNNLGFENEFSWIDNSPLYFTNLDETSSNNGTDLIHTQLGSRNEHYKLKMSTVSDDRQNNNSKQENCVSKGSVSRNNGSWLYTDCREIRKAICKKPTELKSVKPPAIIVQPYTVYVKWIGRCKCRTSVSLVYEQEETGNDRRTRYITFENQTYMVDDKFGLDSGTMYKIHIEASSSVALSCNNTFIDVLFQTPAPYPKVIYRSTSTSSYEEETFGYQRRTNNQWFTTYAPFYHSRSTYRGTTSFRYRSIGDSTSESPSYRRQSTPDRNP